MILLLALCVLNPHYSPRIDSGGVADEGVRPLSKFEHSAPICWQRCAKGFSSLSIHPAILGAGAASGHISVQEAALHVGDEDEIQVGISVGPVVCKTSKPCSLHATDLLQVFVIENPALKGCTIRTAIMSSTAMYA